MTDAYLLIKCDLEKVAQVRRAAHAALENTGTSLVYREQPNRLMWLPSAQYEKDLLSLSDMVERNRHFLKLAKDHQMSHVSEVRSRKVARVVVCYACRRYAVSFNPRGEMWHFLKRLGWKVRTRPSVSRTQTYVSHLVCQKCARLSDSPVSVFSEEYRACRNRGEWVDLA